MAEEIRNKFVSWTLNVVKEIKEIPAKKSPPSPTSAALSSTSTNTSSTSATAPSFPSLAKSSSSSSSIAYSASKTTTSKSKKKGNEIYGVGINLAFVQQPSASSSSSSSAPPPPRVGVHSLEPTGPASKAGLQPGDIILSANTITFHSHKYYVPDDVAAAIRGPEGSPVKVLVERNGTKLEFDLIREPIGVIPSSSTMMMMMPTSTTTNTATTTTSSSGTDSASDPPAPDASNRGGHAIMKSKENEATNMDTKSSSTSTNSNPNDKKKKNAFNSLLHSLSLSEDEQKSNEKELTSSLEDADQFNDDDIVVATTTVTSSNITSKRSSSSSAHVDTSSSATDDKIDSFEEKTIDSNEDDDNNTIQDDDHSTSTNQQWEMLSDRSGSTAILISYSGGSMSNASYSFPSNRTPSPSVLKNKFVLTESNGEAYIHHVVLPTDTLQGLCLAYKLSATRLRMENNFSGNSLQLAPKKLRIPNNVGCSSRSSLSSSSSKGGGVNSSSSNNNKGMMIRVQDTTSKEYKLYAFVAEIPTMELVEAKAYLDLSNWDLEEALRSAREDEGWSLRNNDGDVVSSSGQGGEITFDSSSSIMALVKPKALTAHDIYSGMPPYDGDGFELSDIKQR